MIQLIGLKNNLDIEIREQLSLPQSRIPEFMKKINESANGSLILSTCNRTEIYIDSDKLFSLERLFNILGWDDNLTKHVFQDSGEKSINHIMEVACGFHSKIPGEDQILGQIRDALSICCENALSSSRINRLFQIVLACGKEFRTVSGLNKIPVSSSSIVSSQCSKRNIESAMIIGYGEVGRLVEKYLISTSIRDIYIVVRNKSKLVPIDDKIKYIEFNEKKDYYGRVDSIISCTSSPHVIVSDCDLPDKDYVLFDMAVPRDIDGELDKREKVQLIDIDRISLLDDENKEKRKRIMLKNKYVIKEKTKEFLDKETVMEIVPHIMEIKKSGNMVTKTRMATFRNKKDSKDSEKLAKAMIESTSNFYVNKAIKVLKNAQLKGNGDECLSYIKEIFMAAE